MTKYTIRYTIDGAYTVEANSKEEAQEKFDNLSLYDLAGRGDLTADTPLTDQEYEAQIVEAITAAPT